MDRDGHNLAISQNLAPSCFFRYKITRQLLTFLYFLSLKMYTCLITRSKQEDKHTNYHASCRRMLMSCLNSVKTPAVSRVLCQMCVLLWQNRIDWISYLQLADLNVHVFIHLVSLDVEICDCHVPCFQSKYHSEISYSKFPDADTADRLISGGYYDDVQYQR